MLDTVLLGISIGIIGLNPTSIMDWYVVSLFGMAAGAGGLAVAVVASPGMVDRALNYRVKYWHRVIFVYTLLTLMFMASVVLVPATFIGAGLFWAFVSPIGLVFAPVLKADRELARANTMLGITLTICGVFLEIAHIPILAPGFPSIISVVGGLMAILGIGHHV
jgi:hypothetical protein